MFCLLCKKHDTENYQNKKKVFNVEPATRFRPATLREHVQDKCGKRIQHTDAILKEHLQRVSCFEAEIQKDKLYGDEGLMKTFMACYFVAKQEMANAKLVPMLEFLESIGVSAVGTFKHRSKGSIQEVFKTVGEAVRDQTVKDLEKVKCFGLLCDDVADISNTEQMVTFVQYIKNGKAEVRFLAVYDLLKESSSANAETMLKVLLAKLHSLGIDLNKVTSLVSDGASVMTGKKGGFAARLRQICPTLTNVHCICHRLALACTDTLKEHVASQINKMQLTLVQLWKYFDNSPKRTSTYLKVQLNQKKVTLTEPKKKIVLRRLQKACQTRWLSFEKAVSAVYDDLASIMFTLSELAADAAAEGFLKKMKAPTWIGTLYVLHEVLPVLSHMSKTFQGGTVNYSSIRPVVESTIAKLNALPTQGSAINDFEQDFQEGGRLYILTQVSNVTVTPSAIENTKKLQQKYITALTENIRNRFDPHVVPVIAAFDVFNPTSVPAEDSDQFPHYGESHAKVLSEQFYGHLSEEEKNSCTMRLLDEVRLLKYSLSDIQKNFPPNMEARSTELALDNLVGNASYASLMPLTASIADVALSLPVSNAWPERGASALKRIKTRLRSSLSQEMLAALMQISINGPQLGTSKCETLICMAVDKWNKKRRVKSKTLRPEIPTANTTSLPETDPDVSESETQIENLPRDADEEHDLEKALEMLNLDRDYLGDILTDTESD